MSLRIRPIHAAAFTALALASLTRSASAWVEAHVVADDVRVTLERDAPARVEHRITLHIAGGPLRALDLRGVDGDAEPEADAYVVTEHDASVKSLASAREVTAELIPPDNKPTKDGSPAPSILRLRLGEKGIGRGQYVVLVRYRTHLAERGFVKHDGTVARVKWQGVVWEDGFDSARVTFDLPSAPTPPRHEERTAGEGGGDAPLVLSTVRRRGDRDEIELLRPYVPTGEAISWSFLADGRAFAPVAPAPTRPGDAPMISIAQPSGAVGRFGAVWLAGAAAGFLGFVFLVVRKAREVTLAALAAGATPAPLVPMPVLVRAPLASAALAFGVWLQLVKRAWTPSALVILAAVALVAHRAPAWPRSFFLRKPGRWLPLAERDAWAPAERPRGAFLDVSTRAGKALFALSLAAVAGLSWLASEASRHLGAMIALDATVLLALFGTGRLSALPPRPAAFAAPFLRRVSERLAKVLGGSARTVGRIRVPDGAAEPDELRLALVPRPAAQGFRSLEAGAVIVPGAGGPALLPGVVLRYVEGSPCEAQLGAMVRAGKLTRGRKPGEVAVVFSPRLPTARMTADLVARLARAISTPPAPADAPAPKPEAKPRDRARRAA
jgi:hypothetical protein